MDDSENQKAPEPENLKPKKEYSFTRLINPKDNISQTPGKDDLNINKIDTTTFNLTLSLFENEISLVAKEHKENSKLPNISYEKKLDFETLKGFNKFFALLNCEKIFDVIQKSFELNYDQISVENDIMKIKIMITFMEVVTEEMSIELQKIKFSDEEETCIIKESIKLLNNEKDILKKEVTVLNKTIDELRKKLNEKDKIIEEKNTELNKKLEEKENTLNQKLDEKESALNQKLEEKNSALSQKLDEKESSLNQKLEEKNSELNQKLEEKNSALNQKLEEKERDLKDKQNELNILVQKLQNEMLEMKKIQKYVKEKLDVGEKIEKEKEKKSHNFTRQIKIKEDIFDMEINMILIEEKIKFLVKEIQDNLKNNPIIYETFLELNDFNKIADYYKNQGGIEAIYDFLVQLFDGKKDTLKRNENKIIISVKFPLGIKDEEISFEIFKKEVGLENNLSNIDKSLREINKDIISAKEESRKNLLENTRALNRDLSLAKEEFKKNLLEKVYPIGSYYWSEKSISPDNIFGGSWKKIEGRFLFASNYNHSVGETGGEERHYLTIDEIPSHSHQYVKFKYGYTRYKGKGDSSCSACPANNYESDSFTETGYTSSTGSSNPHNNMPPFLVANCWKRIG